MFADASIEKTVKKGKGKEMEESEEGKEEKDSVVL